MVVRGKEALGITAGNSSQQMQDDGSWVLMLLCMVRLHRLDLSSGMGSTVT